MKMFLANANTDLTSLCVQFSSLIWLGNNSNKSNLICNCFLVPILVQIVERAAVNLYESVKYSLRLFPIPVFQHSWLPAALGSFYPPLQQPEVEAMHNQQSHSDYCKHAPLVTVSISEDKHRIFSKDRGLYFNFLVYEAFIRSILFRIMTVISMVPYFSTMLYFDDSKHNLKLWM